MEQAMTGDVMEMSTGDMIEVMQTMDQMNELNPDMQAMMQEMISRQGELEGMTQAEREAAIHEMEEKYGVPTGGDGGFDRPEQVITPEFQEYMESQYGFVDMTQEQVYAYEQDFYFGEFDFSWDSQTGLYVNSAGDTLTEEQYETISDGTPCFCPCCDVINGDPEANCPGWSLEVCPVP